MSSTSCLCSVSPIIMAPRQTAATEAGNDAAPNVALQFASMPFAVRRPINVGGHARNLLRRESKSAWEHAIGDRQTPTLITRSQMNIIFFSTGNHIQLANKQSGAVEACWALNPEVRRSKLKGRDESCRKGFVYSRPSLLPVPGRGSDA